MMKIKEQKLTEEFLPKLHTKTGDKLR